MRSGCGVYARSVPEEQYGRVRSALARVDLVEMSEEALALALRPMPITLRTLDAMHVATADHLRSIGGTIELASYDARMLAAARALGIPIAAL